ncbi:MAG: hypothetical protein ABSH50_09320 [Bryobacteraceae bacterium]|jgi:hypothetical protein
MRAFKHGLMFVLIMQLAGCTLHDKKQASAPPPPKPAAVAPPATDPQPLSSPQTSVTLPSPQPVNPDAIPPVKTEATPAPAEKPEVQAVPQRSTRHASSPQRSEAEPEAETPAAPAEEQPAFQPILTPEEQKRIAGLIESRKKEIGALLVKAKHTTADQTKTQRINSFLSQSDEARQRGDYAQAESLSERAVILARELGE